MDVRFAVLEGLMKRRWLAGLHPRPLVCSPLLLALAVLGCREEPTQPTVGAVAARGAKVSSDPVVQSVVPDEAPRNFTLDVTVKGSGFDPGSTVRLEQNGQPVSGVTTNSTTFVSSSQLRASLTIDAGVVPDRYDVAVITSGGKRGIGVERFEVLEVVWLGPLDGEALLRATLINSLGHISGWSATTPFFWSEATGPEWVWSERTWWAIPTAFNDLDQVVGYTCGLPAGSCSDYSRMYGMRWSRGAGGGWSATVITDPGNIPSGLTNDGELFYSEFLGESGWRPWRKVPGQAATILPVPPGRSPAATIFANNTGQAVSGSLFWWFAPSGPHVMSLSVPAGASSANAAAIADQQGNRVYLVGTGTFNGSPQPVRWTLSQTSDGQWTVASERLPIPGKSKAYSYGYGRGINSSGDAVGFFPLQGYSAPIKWYGSGGYTILPHLKGMSSGAYSINGAGWIVGHVDGVYNGALLWRP